MTNIKKVVIWALVLVNVFFLANILWGVIDAQKQKAETLENLCQLLRQNGIEITADDVHEGAEQPEFETSRDLSAEQLIADEFFAPTEMSDQDGNEYIYTGKDGRAVFRNGGEFDIAFSEGAYQIQSDALNMVKNLLNTMNITAASFESGGDKGNEIIQAVCTWEEMPVFNCRITFVFKDGFLTEITGKNPAGIEPTGNNADMSSAATGLLHFLSDIKKGKFSCSRIFRVDPGYNYVSQSALGDGTLRLVWRIEADTGVYFVDGITGDVEQAAS